MAETLSLFPSHMNLTRNGEMRESTFGIAVVGGTQTDLSRFEVIEILTSCNYGDVKQHHCHQ